MKKNKSAVISKILINVIFLSFIIGVLMVFSLPVKAETTNVLVDASLPLKIRLNAPIPGLEEFSQADGVKIDNSSIAKYIGGVYKFFIGIAGILAVFMITFGGIQWLFSGGRPEAINKAKEIILGSIAGLVLAVGSYTILYNINPALVTLKSLPIAILEGDTEAPLASPIIAPATVYCPKAGGAAEVAKIVDGLKGNVAYRLGGKGGPPPYNADNENCSDGPCRNYCPANNICLDCSGFVNYVLDCANLPYVNGGTYQIFGDAEKINSIDGDKVNGTTLQIGDLIGWRAGEGASFGHVLIYIGNGQIADSHGGAGRLPGNAIGVYNLSSYSKKELFRYVKRVSG